MSTKSKVMVILIMLVSIQMVQNVIRPVIIMDIVNQYTMVVRVIVIVNN